MAPTTNTVDTQSPSTTSVSSVLGKLIGQHSKPAVESPTSETAAPDAAAISTPASPVSTAKSTASSVSTVSLRAVPAATVRTAAVPSGVLGLVLTGVAELGLAATVSVVSAIVPSPTAPSPTLSLNGYKVVPNSPETVTSLYGKWTYLPGAPSLVQGTQQFDLVDPKTNTTVGTFNALVSRGDGYNYTELIVTSNGGTNVGTAAGQVPPVGSVVSAFSIGGFGMSYTSIPSTSKDVVSFKLVTPFGDIPLPMPFDGAKGIADHTVDNRPVQLTNGYYIAPADPQGETLTGTSGVLPFFSTVQGNQTYNIYNAAGQPVGSFKGIFTTTADIVGDYTQAILVTSNDGTNVGTGAGQVPPVGSVYNVSYAGNDQNYVLYSSLPSPSGDVVSVSQVTPTGVTNSGQTFIDASAPPSTQTLTGPNGYKYVPTSPLQPVGVNGLPPREVQIQGYQQFDVYDSAGKQIGSVDADVYTQWDLFGIRSNALLITNVTDGTAGTGTGDVAPVGSVLNFVNFGNGFGTAQSVTPTATGDVSLFNVTTPLGSIPLLPYYAPVPTRTEVDFFDPFTSI